MYIAEITDDGLILNNHWIIPIKSCNIHYMKFENDILSKFQAPIYTVEPDCEFDWRWQFINGAMYDYSCIYCRLLTNAEDKMSECISDFYPQIYSQYGIESSISKKLISNGVPFILEFYYRFIVLHNEFPPYIVELLKEYYKEHKLLCSKYVFERSKYKQDIFQLALTRNKAR